MRLNRRVVMPLAAATLVAACGPGRSPTPTAARPSVRPAPTAVATPAPLTLQMAVGQMVVVGFGGTAVTPELRHLIVDEKVGGVILFTGNFGGTADGARQLALQLQELGREAGLPAPLLVTTDEEGGDVARITSGIPQLPTARALGSSGPDAVTAQVSATAKGLASCGIALDLAPDADLRSNPADAVIGDRSFGSDQATVGPLVAAYVTGLHLGGVGATLKHFPGLGGAAGDPHDAIPTDPVDMATWEQTSARSFASGIAAGADAVMTTAVYVPGLDTDGRPAMLSRAVVTGLLRQRLGFRGVIVTDSLSLGGLQATTTMPQSIVEAAQAGNDLLLLSNDDTNLEDASIAALTAAVTAGTVPLAQVRESAQRVIDLRWRYPTG